MIATRMAIGVYDCKASDNVPARKTCANAPRPPSSRKDHVSLIRCSCSRPTNCSTLDMGTCVSGVISTNSGSASCKEKRKIRHSVSNLAASQSKTEPSSGYDPVPRHRHDPCPHRCATGMRRRPAMRRLGGGETRPRPPSWMTTATARWAAAGWALTRHWH